MNHRGTEAPREDKLTQEVIGAAIEVFSVPLWLRV